MNIRWVLLFSGLFLVGGLAHSSRAVGVDAWPCEGCSWQQLRSRAAALGEGVHHLYSFQGGTLRRFEVARDPDSQIGSVVFTAEERPVPASLLNYFDKLNQVRGALGDLSKILVELAIGPGSPIGDLSAFNIARSGAAQTSVTDMLREDANTHFAQAGLASSTAGNLASLLQGLDKVFTQGELLEVTVVLIFRDGSRAAFRFSGSNLLEGFPEYVAGSAEDVNGNRILEPGGQVPNGTEYQFGTDNSPGEFQQWLNHMCMIVSCTTQPPIESYSSCYRNGDSWTCIRDATYRMVVLVARCLFGPRHARADGRAWSHSQAPAASLGSPRR